MGDGVGCKVEQAECCRLQDVPNGERGDPERCGLAGQLSSLRPGQNSRGQFFIEKKDEMRARGLPSPDKADALMLAFLRSTGRVRLWV